MATQSDVENAVADLITASLYPNAGAPPSVVGFPIKVYAGWPDPGTLDADMVEAGGQPAAAHVSIYPLPGERNVTRYSSDRKENPIPAPTYNLSASGLTITVGGVAPTIYTPQNLGIQANGKPYVVHASAGQTPAQLAAALQALIVAEIAGVTVAGPAITFPAGTVLQAIRVGVTGSTTREVSRQEKQFQISVWSSSPASRAAIFDTFDPILKDTKKLLLADGSRATLTYHGSREDDFTQKQRVYRRSLILMVEYPTTITEAATQIIVSEVRLFDLVLALVGPSGATLFELDIENPDGAIWTTTT